MGPTSRLYVNDCKCEKESEEDRVRRPEPAFDLHQRRGHSENRRAPAMYKTVICLEEMRGS